MNLERKHQKNLKKLSTEKFGMLSYTKEDIFHFERGLFNFESYKHFLLFPLKANTFFYGLQSINLSSLGFFLVQPSMLMQDYSLESNERDKYSFDADFAIVSTQVSTDDTMHITMNLLGPLLLNLLEKKGWQIISAHKFYNTKHVLNFPKFPNIQLTAAAGLQHTSPSL